MERLCEGATNDLRTRLGVALKSGDEFIKSRNGLNKSHTTARNNTLFNSGARCIKSVINTVLELFLLRLCCCADLDNSHTADELGKAFLQLFLVVL